MKEKAKKEVYIKRNKGNFTAALIQKTKTLTMKKFTFFVLQI